MHVIHPKDFFHDGRGPELIAVHLASKSSHLLAVDFKNPDSSQVMHLKFLRAQAYMFTPEEVENYATTVVDWGKTGNGALVSLGRSTWLKSFNPRHLERCEHIRIMFYDEYLDVLCEDVVVGSGSYGSGL
jgi:hypothetical protein